MTDTEKKPKVVILGAGYAGAACASRMQKRLGSTIDLTVVDQKNASVHKVATVRGVVLGDKFSERTLVPHDKLVAPENGRVLHGKVTEIKDNELVFESGDVLPYDYLVCATGSINNSVTEVPNHIVDRDEMKRFYRAVAEVIEKSKKIVIVGGGTVGVEIAGEIMEVYDDKKVTIVHNGDKLLSSTNPPASARFHRMLHSKVVSCGIKVLLEQRLNIDLRANGYKPYIVGENEYETSKGEKLKADLVLVCTGTRLLNEIYPTEWLDEKKGCVKVRDTLQILSKDNVFAIGDINDVKENKQALLAEWQGERAAENIALLVKGKTKLGKYIPKGQSMLIATVGSKGGVGYLQYFSVGDWISSWLKGQDLSTKKTWGFFNKAKEIPAQKKSLDLKESKDNDSENKEDPLAQFYEI